MNRYSFTYNPTGEDFGIYEGDNVNEAKAKLAKVNGYDSFDEYLDDNEIHGSELQITLSK